jgi:hypothetical protein
MARKFQLSKKIGLPIKACPIQQIKIPYSEIDIVCAAILPFRPSANS